VDVFGGTNSYALAVSSGDRHGFSSFPDRKRTDPPREFTVNVHSVEADWDDENQRVKVRVEIGVMSDGATVEITQIRYWVAILAQM